MLDLKPIKKELLRLSGLSFQPTAPEGWSELATVLQRRCLTMDHVERVLDRWLENERDMPKPCDLVSLCNEVPADAAMDNPVLAEPCEECAPQGLWRWVDRLDPDGEPVGCHARCTCPRGRQLAAMDAKRASEDAARNRKLPIRFIRVGRAER